MIVQRTFLPRTSVCNHNAITFPTQWELLVHSTRESGRYLENDDWKDNNTKKQHDTATEWRRHYWGRNDAEHLGLLLCHLDSESHKSQWGSIFSEGWEKALWFEGREKGEGDSIGSSVQKPCKMWIERTVRECKMWHFHLRLNCSEHVFGDREPSDMKRGVLSSMIFLPTRSAQRVGGNLGFDTSTKFRFQGCNCCWH